MDKLRIRCRSCNKELEGAAGKSVCCGCSNMTSIIGDRITAKDLSQVVIVSNTIKKNTHESKLSDSDIAWQQQRKARKIRRLDFEVR